VGVLFTIFGPGGQKNGEFPQELDPDWSDFEHFWRQLCSLLTQNLITERQLWPPGTAHSPTRPARTGRSVFEKGRHEAVIRDLKESV
jgi:hypothetical protein